jgi:hypothetical protein
VRNHALYKYSLRIAARTDEKDFQVWALLTQKPNLLLLSPLGIVGMIDKSLVGDQGGPKRDNPSAYGHLRRWQDEL